MPKGIPKSGERRTRHYTPRIADRICEHIALGASIKQALDKEPLGPSIYIFWRWLNDYPDFREKYERARQMQADMQADRVLMMVSDVLEHPKNAAAYRVAMDALRWTAEVRNPKKFGQKIQYEVQQQMKPEEIQKEISRLQNELHDVIDVKAISVESPKEPDEPAVLQ